MQGKEQKAYVPKLSIKGDNWVMYQDRILWVMKQNQIKEHITADAPPTTYTSKGTVGGITPQERWEREEHAICTALGNSMLDKVFNQIKDTESVNIAQPYRHSGRLKQCTLL